MASSLLALIDDIATVLDDVSVMTKVAAKKTAGVLGDDLALNAQQVTGVKADRELPVVWAVAKGSLRNKLILVPAALLISAFIPWAVTPLLMLGGAFLCFEGFEKLAHRFLHADDDAHARQIDALSDPSVDMVAFERDKISGAVRTDFILSAEIIAITLGTVATASFAEQVVVLAGIAIIMALSKSANGAAQRIGRAILAVAPWLMKSLSVVGTAAMFMVGGGILTHGFKTVHEWIESSAEHTVALPYFGSVLAGLTPTVLDAAFGILAGGLVFAAVTLGGRLVKRKG